MGRVEVLSGRDRRRRWTREEKLSILKEAATSGLRVAEVARRHAVVPQQIYQWRRHLLAAVWDRSTGVPDVGPAFLPVTVVLAGSGDDGSEASPPSPPVRSVRRGRIKVRCKGGRSLAVAAGIGYSKTMWRQLQDQVSRYTGADAGQNVAENNVLETAWDLASLALSLAELGDAISSGDTKAILLAAAAAAFDTGTAVIPFLPGGAGAALKLSRESGRLTAKVIPQALPAAVKPQVIDAKLSNLIDNVYKGASNPNRVGNGSLGDAVRYELATGSDVHGRSHVIKAEETIKGLNNWLNNADHALSVDRAVAIDIIADLQNALRRKP